MELRVETASDSTLPPGCFVGVRVGDVLKQGRYEPQRCYHFPKVDRGRNAKIDIYRHVGSCILPIDPEATSVQGVSVASNDPTLPAINLNVNMQPTSVNLGKHREEKRKRVAGLREELKTESQDYLQKFSIEEKLSSAVKALLKEQPANPTEFLCRYLSSLGDSISYPSTPMAKVVAQSPLDEPATAIQPVLSNSGKFADYHKAQCLPNCSGAFYESLDSKFPGYRPAASSAQAQGGSVSSPQVQGSGSGSPVSSAQLQGGSSFHLRPSVGTWLAKPSPRRSDEQPQRNLCIMPSGTLMGPQFYSLGLPNTMRVL